MDFQELFHSMSDRVAPLEYMAQSAQMYLSAVSSTFLPVQIILINFDLIYFLPNFEYNFFYLTSSRGYVRVYCKVPNCNCLVIA